MRRSAEQRLEQMIVAEGELRRLERADDQRAVEKAEVTLLARLEGMNQFRNQIQEERNEYVRREFVDQQIEAGTQRHDVTNRRIDSVERWQFKIVGGLALATVIAPLLTGVVVYLLTRSAIPVQTPSPTPVVTVQTPSTTP